MATAGPLSGATRQTRISADASFDHGRADLEHLEGDPADFAEEVADAVRLVPGREHRDGRAGNMSRDGALVDRIHVAGRDRHRPAACRVALEDLELATGLVAGDEAVHDLRDSVADDTLRQYASFSKSAPGRQSCGVSDRPTLRNVAHLA